MSNETFGHQLPAEVVREDYRLEKAAESASLSLAKLRWHWTDNPDNERAVSYRAYARAIEQPDVNVRKYAQGYVAFTHSESERTLAECIERSTHAAEKQMVIETVAQAHNTTYINARQRRAEEVKEVRRAVENKAEKLEEEGKEFTPDDRAEYAQKVVETKKRLRDHDERERARLLASHSWQFMDAMARVGKARESLRAALKIIRDTEFTDDEKEVIEQTNSDTQALSTMITAALTGDSGVDWDKELAALDGRAQDGE